MPYYNTPQAADRINATQPLIQANFTTINTDFSVDHIGFNAAAHNGKHKQITFVQQAGAPAFAANEIGLYNIASALCLYNSYTAKTVPLTTKTYVPGGNANFFYLPSGLLVKFGTTATDGTGHLAAPINLDAIGGVAYTSVPFVLVAGTQTPPGGGGVVIVACVRSITSAALDINARRSDTGVAYAGIVQWLTIGVY